MQHSVIRGLSSDRQKSPGIRSHVQHGRSIIARTSGRFLHRWVWIEPRWL